MRGGLKQDYGPGVHEILRDMTRQENAATSMPEVDDPDMVSIPPNDPGMMMMRLRRKRQAALLKQILKQGGYGDLARMVSFQKVQE